MKPEVIFQYKFVEFIPTELEDRTIYISMEYATATHKCACGCGYKVVTPFSPTDWQLIFDGKSVSFSPSIGNWSFPCGSHYWIKNNKVRWSTPWSKERIEAGREYDLRQKQRYFEDKNDENSENQDSDTTGQEEVKRRKSLWQWLKDKIS